MADQRGADDTPFRTDFIDYPTGWRIQKETPGLEHHPDCSSVEGSNGGMGGPAFLCDCAAMPVEWARRAIEMEPEREAEIMATLQRYLPGGPDPSGPSVPGNTDDTSSGRIGPERQT